MAWCILAQTGELQPSLHRACTPATVAMPPHPKANTKAKARAQAKAKARALQAARRLLRAQLTKANSRQKRRRHALVLFNTLTVELQLATRPLVYGRYRHVQVEGAFVFCSAGVMTPPFALDSVMLR